MPPFTRADAPTVVRRMLLALCGIGLAGTSTELLLLGHYEDARQSAPLVLMAAAIAGLVVQAWRPSRVMTLAFRALMVALILAGAAGVVFHFLGNLEFQRDMDPEASAMALFWKVLRAKAPPALAPGSLAQLGILGLIATYRHPALRRGDSLGKDVPL
jgi:hypothetical protein